MRFRKRPVEIEAWLFAPGEQQPRWLREAINRGTVYFSLKGGDDDPRTPTGEGYLIKTLEGTMLAEHGDWIIQGVKGEIYPCKPDIFAMTYAPVPVKEGT